MGRIQAGGQAAIGAQHVIEPAIDAVLHNWARWVGGLSAGSGSSSMWRFASRGSRSASYDVVSTVVPIDPQQARLVEALVCNPAFSPRMRSLLKAHYVTRTHPMRTCRDLGLHQDSYDEWACRAALYFAGWWSPRQSVHSSY